VVTRAEEWIDCQGGLGEKVEFEATGLTTKMET